MSHFSHIEYPQEIYLICAQSPYLLHHLGCSTEILEIHTLKIWCMSAQPWNWMGASFFFLVYAAVRFLFWRLGKAGRGGGGEITGLKIKNNFGTVEKVRAIKQLKKETITSDEDRWVVFVGRTWKLSGSNGGDMAWLKAIWPDSRRVCNAAHSQLYRVT